MEWPIMLDYETDEKKWKWRLFPDVGLSPAAVARNNAEEYTRTANTQRYTRARAL